LYLVIGIAIGGAVGSVARYFTNIYVVAQFGAQFPWGTVVVNVVGSLIMGILVEAMNGLWSPTPDIRAMLMVGLLGAFTTFSTFSLDVALLYGRGDLLGVAGYVSASVLASIFALFAGFWIVRTIAN